MPKTPVKIAETRLVLNCSACKGDHKICFHKLRRPTNVKGEMFTESGICPKTGKTVYARETPKRKEAEGSFKIVGIVTIAAYPDLVKTFRLWGDDCRKIYGKKEAMAWYKSLAKLSPDERAEKDAVTFLEFLAKAVIVKPAFKK